MKILSLCLFVIFSLTALCQIPSYVPVNGLKSYWPFSGNVNDASVNASHLTNHSAVLTTDRFGNANAAYSFNGSNQYLDQTSPSFTFGDNSDFTISAWVSKASTSSGVALMNGSNASGNFIWLLQGGATTMSYGTNKQQSAWTFITAPFTVNNWDHYVCVYQSGSMSFYKNNTLQSTGTMNHPNITTANLPFYVGRGINGNYFNGSIDDIGIWDRALTACEITDLFNATSTLTTVSAGPDSTVCSGSAFVLSGSGASTYVWNNGITNGVSFNPTTAQTYTVTGYDAAGCSAWDQVNISLIPNQISAGSDQLICLGSTTIVNASGGSNYTWSNGVTDGVPFTPTTTTYTVTGTGANGCVGSDQVNITQYLPLINAGPSSINVCEGNEVTLSGSGGVSYVWDNNVIDSVSFVPLTSTLYTVTGTDTAGCTNTDQIQVNVIPLPVVDAGPDLVICEGDQVTLSATGANGYSWNNGVQNNVPFTPTSSATYTVIGTDQNNCKGTDDVTVTLNPITTTTLDISAIDQYILNGQTYTSSGTYNQTLNNANGCDSIITLNLSLGFTNVEDFDQFSFTFFPNPATNILFLELDIVNSNQTLEIYTSEGKLVKSELLQSSTNQIDIGELAKGYYVGYIISGKENRGQFKFVKE